MTNKIINTPDLLKGVSFKKPPIDPDFSLQAIIGDIIKTSPSGFDLQTAAFGGKRKKSQVKQLYIHHTAGKQRSDKGKGTVNTFNGRITSGQGKGSSHQVIDGSGHTETLVPWDSIAYCQGPNNTIGQSVELSAYGYLDKIREKDGKKLAYRLSSKGGFVGNVLLENTDPGVDFNEKPIPGGYKNKGQYQKYTPAQITATIQWIQKWIAFFNIPFKFNQDAYNQMFPSEGKSEKATNNEPGVFSHNSNNLGKSDIFPQKELIAALKTTFK